MPAEDPQGPRPAGGAAFWIAALLVIAGGVGLAAHNRFVHDDAFIVFRYSRNLAEGVGLVWNPGQRVEGYTSPLWTLMIAGAMERGADPVQSAQRLGLCFFGLALAGVLFLGRRLSGSSVLGLLLTAVYALNYSLSCYATGGLETSMHLALEVAILATLLGILGRPGLGAARAGLLSVLCGLAFVTRMESAIWIAPAMVLAVLRLGRSPERASTARWLLLLAPALLLAAALFAHRVAYYGEWLPNTYHAKSGAPTNPELGVAYLRAFVENYGFQFLVPLMVLGLGLRLARRSAVGHRAMAAVFLFVLAAWSAYLISVNGDYMEFRFMTPTVVAVLGLAAVAARPFAGAGWGLPRGPKALARWALAAVLLGQCVWAGRIQWKMQQEVEATLNPGQSEAPGLQPADFGYQLPDNVVPISNLRKNLYGRKPHWVGVGEALFELFEGDPTVRIAVSAAGAIPYFSRLPTLDLMGLNDAWVARHGVVQGDRAGHTRYATPEYVVQHADLSLGHPLVVNRRQLEATMAGMVPQRFWVPSGLLEPGARYLVLPLDERTVVVMLQLRAHPAIDALVAERGVRSFPVSRRGP